MSLVIRKADSLDIPFLQIEQAKTNWEQVDLKKSLVWVAEYDEKAFAFLALRLVWQFEPLMIFRKEGIPEHIQKKGCLLLYRAAAKFLFDPTQNTTGIYWAFLHTEYQRVEKWMKKLNWHRCYAKGKMFATWFTPKMFDEE
jgi:hypothetical protein